jgi:hypothetical protein
MQKSEFRTGIYEITYTDGTRRFVFFPTQELHDWTIWNKGDHVKEINLFSISDRESTE